MTAIPGPNLRGDYHGSCVVCLRGTDTALAFTGEAEWLIAGLKVLGVPRDQASSMVVAFFADMGAAPGMVLDGDHTMTVRVCASCVASSASPFPAPGLAAFGVPEIRRSDTGA